KTFYGIFQAAAKNMSSVPNLLADSGSNPPLVVDLDGTLLETDLLHESVIRLVKVNPWALFLLPIWLLRGRAYLKQRLLDMVPMDAATIPMQPELLALLQREHEAGRVLIAATASNQNLARLVVGKLELFNYILGSDEKRNLKGQEKLS